MGIYSAQLVQIHLLNFLFPCLICKLNSLGPDDFTSWRRAKWEKCSIQTKDRVKCGKDLIPSVGSREALEDRGEQFDMTVEERRRQKDNTRVVQTGVEQADKRKSRLL